jgi:hypothetical protein
MQIEILRFVRSGSRMEKRLGGSELGVESWAYKNILAGTSVSKNYSHYSHYSRIFLSRVE